MTEQEADKAVSTFEFPGFTAEAEYGFFHSHCRPGRWCRHWKLRVYDEMGGQKSFLRPQDWLRVYAYMREEGLCP